MATKTLFRILLCLPVAVAAIDSAAARIAAPSSFLQELHCVQQMASTVEAAQTSSVLQLCRQLAQSAPNELPPATGMYRLGSQRQVLQAAAPERGDTVPDTDAEQGGGACFTAMNRFGYGSTYAERENGCGGSAQQWLAQQIGQDGVPANVFSAMPGSKEALQQRERIKDDKDKKNAYVSDTMRGEIAARVEAAVLSSTPFTERLVAFWSNHFNVYRMKGEPTRLTIGAYEREAIRPHVHGSFAAMLQAVAAHPAMLFYLDNQQSVDPGSSCSNKGKKGLNENLGRELLELHTLGVDGGYTQADVVTMAEALAGWSINFKEGVFEFKPQCHVHKQRTFLGQPFAASSKDKPLQQTQAMLDAMAAHPATIEFLARKLAVHFVADNPSEESVNRLQAAFVRGNGDLQEVYRTLITLPEIWERPLTKAKTPFDLLVSAVRATGSQQWLSGQVREKKVDGLFNKIGAYKLWNNADPDGWPDSEEGWLSSQSVTARTDWCWREFPDMQQKAKSDVEAITRAVLLDAPDAKRQLDSALAKSGDTSAQHTLAVLCASPWFQRR